jgi:adenylate cyclase
VGRGRGRRAGARSRDGCRLLAERTYPAAGTIEHFAGDGLMVLFNAPMSVENHALRAVQMPLAMRESLTGLSAGWRKRGHALGFGVDIAGGTATIGTIGFEQRLEEASRETTVQSVPQPILLRGSAERQRTSRLRRASWPRSRHIGVEDLGEFALKGFHRPLCC